MTPVVGKGGRAESRIRESAADPRQLRQAAAEEARRTDRAVLCALLRHRWNEAGLSARPRKCFEAAADPCLCFQSEPHLPADSGCGDAAGTPQPAAAGYSLDFVLQNCTCNELGAFCGRFATFKAPNRKDSTVPGPQLPSSDFAGLRHGLLVDKHSIFRGTFFLGSNCSIRGFTMSAWPVLNSARTLH